MLRLLCRTSLLLRLLGHTDAGAREKAAKLLGLLVPALSPHQVSACFCACASRCLGRCDCAPL